MNINLTLTLEKRDSLLNGMVCYEPVDMEVLDKLRNSRLLVSSFSNPLTRDMVGSEVKQLNRYKSLVNKGTKLARVLYKRSMKYGRCLVQNSIGLFGMRRKIRHTLANRVGFCDLDIINAHPDILLQICKSNGLECDKLDDYVRNRDDILNRIMEEIPCLTQKREQDRDRAKNLFIRILYFGKWENWLDEKKDRDGNVEEPYIPLEHLSPWLVNKVEALSVQLKKIGELILKANPQLVKEVKKSKEEKKQKEYNEMGAVVSFFLQEHENRVLEAVYQMCLAKGYIRDNVCVLCADGIMLETNLLPAEEILCEELNTISKEKCGLNLRWKKKGLDEDMIDILDDNMLGIASLDQTKLAKWDGKYFNSLGSYAEKKIYFENFVCKIMKPDPAYVFMETENADIGKTNVFYSQGKITEAFNHLKSGEVCENGEEIKFMTKWLADEEIKVHTRMDFRPRPDHEPDDETTFNLFAGFNPHINTPYNHTDKERYLKHFKGIGKALCGGDDKYWEFFLFYLAHIVQFPHEKIPIAFIIKGKQGTGKNVFLGVIGTIIGLAHYITSSNPKDFFGDYAEGFYHKLLVNMNECEGRDTFDFEGRIKSFITEDTITLNRKFVQPISIMNLARLIITTNKPTPIPIDIRSKERRYVVYETTDEYLDAKYGTQFWTKLIAHFKRPEVIACIYDYLMEQDIKDYDWRANRPITKAYIQMCKNFIPAEVLFLENKIRLILENDWAVKHIIVPQSHPPYEEGETPELMEPEIEKNGMLGTTVYKEFDDYAKEFGLFRGKDASSKPKITVLYSRLRELNLEQLINKKVGNQEYFFFNATKLLAELKEKGLVSRNEDEVVEKIMKEVNAGMDFADDFA
jgi:hypothetical protein